MDTEVDLTTVDRDVLIAIIAELQAVIEQLERRIAELEGLRRNQYDPLRNARLKPSSGRQPPAQQQPRKQRRHGFARRAHDAHPAGGARDGELSRLRDSPDWGLDSAHSGSHRVAGGSGTGHRARLHCSDLPGVPAPLYAPGGTGRCGFADGSASASTCSAWVATLREEARMPFRTIQRYLDTVHQLRVSEGAIVGAIRQTAQKAQPIAGILDRIRASPVVHADETGWRQSGANGYVWTFSTPTERYFLRRGRGKTVVDEALSDAFSGVLVSDFCAYHHYDGAAVLGPPAAGHP